MLKQYTILFAILALTLLLWQYLSFRPMINSPICTILKYPLINNIEDNPDNSQPIGFSTLEYQQAKLQETKLDNEYDLTAVLLHWRRLEGVKNILQYLLNSNLFKQIIVWNNNPQSHLTPQNFTTNMQLNKSIHIINSKENLKDEAKYRACTHAKTRACFYVDDDWDVSQYLKSLISSYRSDPHLLHSVTNAYTFYTNLVWTYVDPEIDLHSGFSWIGCGSVFLRQHAEQHLQLMHKFLQNHTDLIRLSDVFFSVWLNNIPVQINTNIRYLPSHLSDQSVSFSSQAHFDNLQHASAVLAIRILERSLRSDHRFNEDQIKFPRQQNRRFPVYTKSTSIHDNFIFYTNILPFYYQNIPFNISRDYERGTRKNLPKHPSVDYFLHHNTWKSVDGDYSTCWNAHREIRSNDFYAIDLLSIQTNVTFAVAVAHSPRLQTNLDLRVSLDGLRWLSYRSKDGVYEKKDRTFEEHLHTYLFVSNEFNPGYQSFRYISFHAKEDWDYHFRVCEIEMISKTKVTNVIREFNHIKT